MGHELDMLLEMLNERRGCLFTFFCLQGIFFNPLFQIKVY